MIVMQKTMIGLAKGGVGSRIMENIRTELSMMGFTIIIIPLIHRVGFVTRGGGTSNMRVRL